MLHKTRGIILKTTLYSESSVVVQVFTEQLGIQSYLINGVKKPKAKISINMLQPLHLVDMVVSHKPNISLQRVSELRPSPVFRSIPYDVVKRSIIMFLNEVLYKSIRQQHTDENLFSFLFNAIAWFDEAPEANPNFHLAFLLKLSRFLGFAPSMEHRPDQQFFDLQEGAFRSRQPIHSHYLEKEAGDWFILLYSTSFERLIEIKFKNSVRRHILDKILIFYTLHTASFGEIRSHQILEDILS